MPAIPRLPLIPDPLRRIRVPRDLASVTDIGHEDDPADGGMDRDQVERIWSAVEALFRSGVHPAIALCLRREGAVVLDRAIGYARGAGPYEHSPAHLVGVDSPHVIFSSSKAITATLVHLLDERHVLHIGDRVADYIPEYARNGKEQITIAHVLSHRAGVPNLPSEALDLEYLADGAHILRVMCDQKPASRPGKTLAYHAISGGFILGEVIRRATGKDINTVLTEEILEPFGFEWMRYGTTPDKVDQVVHSVPTGAVPLPPVTTLLARALGKGPDEVTQLSNDPRFLTGVIPAGNTITTANELSRFFEILRRGGELDGKRIMEPRTIRRALTEQSYRDIDWTLGFPTRYGLGFMLGAEVLSLYGPDTEDAFGHLGFTNTVGWADPRRALAGALLTSGKPILYPELPAFWRVMRAIGVNARKVKTSALAFKQAPELAASPPR